MNTAFFARWSNYRRESNISWSVIFIFLTFPIVFVFFGAVFFSDGVQGIAKWYIAQSWPTTTGEILASDLKYTGTSRRAGQETDYYLPQVTYRYRVDGIDYTSSKIQNRDRFGSSVYDNIYANNAVKQYVPGNPVTVHYNVHQASEALLMTQIDSQYYFSFVFGLLLLMVGVASSFLVYFPETAWKFLRKSRKPIIQSSDL